ncbi:MAG TPA: YbhB/YbcL family Raf kinase inhibitor-like protein [Caulobacteraceae bacterium]|nr:YbhB/YbcL family Raf kinase inhibitor-like protein [Caulobacteraceae bacterium]
MRNLIGAVLALGLFGAAVAQTPPRATEAAADKLAINLFPAKAALTVTTPAFQEGGDFPFENTQYRADVFPGLSWSRGPKGTQSYVLIMQDGDSLIRGDATLHWTMFNVPAGTTKLEPNMTGVPAGAMWGPNQRMNTRRYIGPRSGAGPKHRYHIQVFALDTVIQGDPNLSWTALKAAIAGHVLAAGQVMGLSTIDPTAPAPAPPPASAPAARP